jgi:hypothetical protein
MGGVFVKQRPQLHLFLSGVDWSFSVPQFLLHRCPQLLVGHVQISLRRLEVSMPEKQLNRSQVETLGQPAAGRFVPQIMPVQVNIGELLAVHAAVRARARRLNAVRQQNQT